MMTRSGKQREWGTISLKERIRTGDLVLGTFAFLPSPDVVEILSLAGFDFVIVDMEHAAPDWEPVRNMVRAANMHGTSLVVRVPEPSGTLIKYALESGADGVMVPFIQSDADVTTVHAHTMYPPVGTRGTCPLTRPADYGLNRLKFDQIAAQLNDQTVLIGIVEDAIGMQNLDSILDVRPGLDVVYFGRSDLAASLGVPGQRNHPKVDDYIERAVRAVRHRSGPSDAPVGGMQVHDLRELRDWIANGFNVISVSSDTAILAEAARAVVCSRETGASV